MTTQEACTGSGAISAEQLRHLYYIAPELITKSGLAQGAFKEIILDELKHRGAPLCPECGRPPAHPRSLRESGAEQPFCYNHLPERTEG